MISPIGPQFVRVIHQEKERALQNKIDQLRAAKERAEAAGVVELRRPWYAAVSQWMKGKLDQRARALNAASISDAASISQETFEQPCPTVPC